MKRPLLAAVLVAILLTLSLAFATTATACPACEKPQLDAADLVAAIGLPQLAVAATDVRADNPWVYITKTGAKYHRATCRYLSKSKIKVRLKWAKSHGYKPCKVCKPPR